MSRLEDDERETPRRDRHAEVRRALETLHRLVAPVSPALYVTEAGHLQQRWVGPSLLSAFAMMVVEDLAGDHKVHLCVVCKTPVVSSAYQLRYCSPRCRKRAEMRRYRERLGKPRKKDRRKKRSRLR